MRPSANKHVLAILRGVLEKNQGDFAEAVGCSASTVQAIELDRLNLSPKLALRISLKTGVSVEWLLENKIAAPITLSSGARELLAKAKLDPKTPYTKEIYDLVQAQQQAETDFTEVYHEQLHGLVDYVRLRAIIESARSRHLGELARYQVNQFLKKMEEDFGSDPEKLFLQGARLNAQTSYAFVASELAAARHTFFVDSELSAPEEADPAVLSYVTAQAGIMEKISPYADRSATKVAARPKAAPAKAVKKTKR